MQYAKRLGHLILLKTFYLAKNSSVWNIWSWGKNVAALQIGTFGLPVPSPSQLISQENNPRASLPGARGRNVLSESLQVLKQVRPAVSTTGQNVTPSTFGQRE